MDKKQERNRLNELFKELEQIAESPWGENHDIQKKLDDFRQRLLELRFHSNDPDQILHAILQFLVQRVRVLAAFGFKGSE